MEGLNPNAPPPKMTEVVIRKWEYTDPVGVPHPDNVDIVVELRNDGTASVTGVVVETAHQWRIGPRKSATKATWSGVKSLQTWSSLTLTPGKPTVLRAPIDIATRISELEKKGSWPWRVRALLRVRAAGVDQPSLHREIELPIHPGD